MIRIAIFICLAATIQAQQLNFTLDPDFKMTISGTSNLHDWQSSVTNLTADVKGAMIDNGVVKFDRVRIKIPVEAIISEKGKLMDKKTHQALMIDVHPQITFAMQTTVIPSFGTTHVIEGNLTMAGVTRKVKIPVKCIDRNQKLEISGALEIVMSNYGIDPPKALMGTLKTGDAVQLDFMIPLLHQKLTIGNE